MIRSRVEQMKGDEYDKEEYMLEIRKKCKKISLNKRKKKTATKTKLVNVLSDWCFIN